MKKWHASVAAAALMGTASALAQVNGMDPTSTAAPSGSASAAAASQSDSPMERLQARLALQPAQMVLWRTFTSRVDAYVGLHLREKPALAHPDEAAPRQIARKVDIEQNRLAALEDIEDAARHLYEALDDAQKKVADQLMFDAVPSFTPTGPAGGDRPAQGGSERPRRGGGGGWGGVSGGSRASP